MKNLVNLWSQRVTNADVILNHMMDFEDDSSQFFLSSIKTRSPKLFMSVNNVGEISYPDEVAALVVIHENEHGHKFRLAPGDRWVLTCGVSYFTDVIPPPSITRTLSDPDGLLKAERDWAFQLAVALHRDPIM